MSPAGVTGSVRCSLCIPVHSAPFPMHVSERITHVNADKTHPMYILTNAPDAYDYGHTQPVELRERLSDGRITLRAVQVQTPNTPYHTQYQADRYMSGLYVAIVGDTLAGAIADAKVRVLR